MFRSRICIILPEKKKYVDDTMFNKIELFSYIVSTKYSERSLSVVVEISYYLYAFYTFAVNYNCIDR